MNSPLLPADKLGIEDIAIYAIRRWRIVLVSCVGLVLLSIIAWFSVSRREEPKIDLPMAQVLIPYPGASAEDVERLVAKPIEEELYSLDKIERIDSISVPNVAFFVLSFEEGVDMDVAVEKIRGRVEGRRGDLPQEVRDANVYRVSTASAPAMVVAVAGNRSDAVLTQAAKQVKARLSSLPGVARVDLIGDEKRAVRVQLDPVRLEQHRLSADGVVQQLQLSNVRIPAGELKMGPLVSMIQVNQSFKETESVMQVPVGASSDDKGGSQVVRLGDVAEVKNGKLLLKQRFMSDGQPAVGLEIFFRNTENAIAMGERVREVLAHEKANVPEGISIQIAHDQPKWVSEGISSFLSSLQEGVLLVMIIITLGMGWRAALVVAGVLPLAAAGTIVGLFVLGLSLDRVSLAGLIVALGLVVDDAVVVTESIQVMRDKGLGALRAAVFGTARVFWANNGTTAIACASFVPLFAMTGVTGAYIRGLPIAVVFALVTSLLVAQFFTPWIATYLLKSPANVQPIPDAYPYHRSGESGDEHHHETNPIIRFLRELYSRQVPWIVRNPAKVIVLWTGILVASLVLLPAIGIEFFPKANKPVFFVSVELPRGTREEITAEKVSQVISVIQKQPEVQSTSAMVGGGYPGIFSSRGSRGEATNFGDIYVRLKDDASSEEVAARLRRELNVSPGAKISVEELYYGPSVEHPINIRIYGDDYQKLLAHAEEIKAKIMEQPGAVNVKDSLSDTVLVSRLHLDADKAIRTGVTPAQVGSTLRWLYGEDKVTEFLEGDETIKVVIEPMSAPESPLGVVEQTLIPNQAGGAVPIRQAGTMMLERGFAELTRYNGRRTVDITADVEASVLPADVIAKVDPWLQAKTWEPGYGFSYGGAEEETSKSFGSLALAAVGAMILIFLLLVLMFDNFKLAFVVMVGVPYAMIGAVAGLGLTGNHFGFMSFLGLIALIGVYVNHKIYFVDRFQEILSYNPDDVLGAIVRAGRERLRPVLLTALTAILGLLPLTLGGGRLWAGFGWVNIFGLAISIILSLVLLPAFISIAYRSALRRATPQASPMAAPHIEVVS